MSSYHSKHLVLSLEDFGNQNFVERQAGVSFFAAPKAVFCVGSFEADHQICQIGFNKKDGSVFVSTPYFKTAAGILANASIPSDPPYIISLRESGRVTSHHVKLSHHPDGRVHFSQDGKIRTEIIRQSFGLNDSIGTLFELHVYWPIGFQIVSWDRRRKDRPYLLNRFTRGLPNAVRIRAEWRRKRSIVDNIEPQGSIAGPVGPAIERTTGHESMVHFVGQPRGFRLREHVLLLTCEVIHPLTTLDGTTMVLIGGFDPHEVSHPGELAHVSGCLAWIYPAKETAELYGLMGSVDLVGPFAPESKFGSRADGGPAG